MTSRFRLALAVIGVFASLLAGCADNAGPMPYAGTTAWPTS